MQLTFVIKLKLAVRKASASLVMDAMFKVLGVHSSLFAFLISKLICTRWLLSRKWNQTHFWVCVCFFMDENTSFCISFSISSLLSCSLAGYRRLLHSRSQLPRLLLQFSSSSHRHQQWHLAQGLAVHHTERLVNFLMMQCNRYQK